LKDHEIAIHKAIKNHEITTNNAIKDREIATNKEVSRLGTRVGTGFAEVKIQFAEVRTDSAEVRTDFARLERKISFMQWQIGLVGSAVVAFLGVSYSCIQSLLPLTIPCSLRDMR